MTERRRVLVTGCGRSGTNYMAVALRAAGFDVGHEKMGADGVASWFFGPTHADQMPKPHETTTKIHKDGSRPQDFEFDLVLHQTRHPVLVIPSLVSVYRLTDWRFVHEHVDINPGLPKLRRAMLYWIRWNRQIEMEWRPSSSRYRIEDIEIEWPRIMRQLGASGRPFPRDVSRRVNHQGGYREPDVLTADDLERAAPDVFQPFTRLAERYGYNLNEVPR